MMPGPAPRSADFSPPPSSTSVDRSRLSPPRRHRRPLKNHFFESGQVRYQYSEDSEETVYRRPLENSTAPTTIRRYDFTSPPTMSRFRRLHLDRETEGLAKIPLKTNESPPLRASNAAADEEESEEDPAAPRFALAGRAPPRPPPKSYYPPPSYQHPGKKRWTIEQLRATDGIIPCQMGTNQFASQRGMTGFGAFRNTTTPVAGKAAEESEGPQSRTPEPVVPLQYGTNQFASQKGMSGFGSFRDIAGKHIHSLIEMEFPEHCYEEESNFTEQ